MITKESSFVYRQIYKKRIDRFIGFLQRKNPQWMDCRSSTSWLKDLQTFSLEKDFFLSILFGDDEAISPVDDEKIGFYKSQIEPAHSRFKESAHLKKSQDDYVECGFDIQYEISDKEDAVHRALLGYTWWMRIYIKIRKNISHRQQKSLERKKEMLTAELSGYIQ